MPYRILNWDKYQARTDRSTSPWVKLWKDILNSADYYSIPEKRRWEWTALMLISDAHDGMIHKSDSDIAFILYKRFDTPFDPTPFLGRLIERITSEQDQDQEEDQDKEQEQDPDTSGCQVVTSGNHRSPVVTSGNQPFDRFWSAYPRRVGKQKAQEIWRRKKLDADSEKIIAAVARCKQSDDWKREAGRYIPHPSTWLNRGGWDDELMPLATVKQAAEVQTRDKNPASCPTCLNNGAHRVNGQWVRCACPQGANITQADLERANAA